MKSYCYVERQYMRAHVGTYCRRRQYKQSRSFIPGTLYVIGWQYVPRVPSYIVAGKNMCRGDNICHHRQAAKFNSFINNYDLGACSECYRNRTVMSRNFDYFLTGQRYWRFIFTRIPTGVVKLCYICCNTILFHC